MQAQRTSQSREDIETLCLEIENRVAMRRHPAYIFGQQEMASGIIEEFEAIGKNFKDRTIAVAELFLGVLKKTMPKVEVKQLTLSLQKKR